MIPDKIRNRQSEGYVLISILLAICWFLVALRIYVRIYMAKWFGVDDWFLIAALFFFTGFGSVSLSAIYNGVGTDPRRIPPESLPKAILYWWLAVVLYNPTTLLLRISISVTIHRLCSQRTHRIIIWTTASIVSAYSVFYLILTIMQCNPPNFFWTKYTGGKGVCLDERIFPAATYAHSVVSAVADWILGLLPVRLVWHLQMNRRQKLSICVLLGMGLIAGVAAMIRIPFIRTLGDEKRMFLYHVVDVSLWSLTEPGLGMVAACLSALRPLFRKPNTSSTVSNLHQMSSLDPHQTNNLQNTGAGVGGFSQSAPESKRPGRRSFSLRSIGGSKILNPSSSGRARTEENLANFTFYKTDNDSDEISEFGVSLGGNGKAAVRHRESDLDDVEVGARTGERQGSQDALRVNQYEGVRKIHVATLVRVDRSPKRGQTAKPP